MIRAAAITASIVLAWNAGAQPAEPAAAPPPSGETVSASVRPRNPHAKPGPVERRLITGDVKTDTAQILIRARLFFSNLLLGDARELVAYSGFPFLLESRTLNTPDELMREWLRQLRSKRTDLLTLYDIQVYTPAEMEKKYGKAPARLAQFPLHTGRNYVAVANISGRAAIALFHDAGSDWKVVAYHD